MQVERIRVSCDATHCKAEAWHPAKGWSHETGNRDFCRKHTEQRAARSVCPPGHKHAGVSTCFIQHRCRCDGCVAAHNARGARRAKLKAYGRWDTGLVDAAPVREHVETLLASGLGWKRIAELTDVGNTAISQLIYGRKGSNKDPRKGEQLQRVSRAKAEKILALQPSLEHLRDGALVPSVGTHRRIQALVVNGWSLQRIGERIGVHRSNMTSLMHRGQVEKRTHDAVVALFDELWRTPAPAESWHEKSAATRARNYAVARRWLPALAWDDPDTDREPPAGAELGEDFVDEAIVALAVMGDRPRMTSAERREVVRILHRERWGDPRIAEYTGMVPRTVMRIRQELGLPGIAVEGQAA